MKDEPLDSHIPLRITSNFDEEDRVDEVSIKDEPFDWNFKYESMPFSDLKLEVPVKTIQSKDYTEIANPTVLSTTFRPTDYQVTQLTKRQIQGKMSRIKKLVEEIEADPRNVICIVIKPHFGEFEYIGNQAISISGLIFPICIFLLGLKILIMLEVFRL